MLQERRLWSITIVEPSMQHKTVQRHHYVTWETFIWQSIGSIAAVQSDLSCQLNSFTPLLPKTVHNFCLVITKAILILSEPTWRIEVPNLVHFQSFITKWEMKDSSLVFTRHASTNFVSNNYLNAASTIHKAVKHFLTSASCVSSQLLQPSFLSDFMYLTSDTITWLFPQYFSVRRNSGCFCLLSIYHGKQTNWRTLYYTPMLCQLHESQGLLTSAVTFPNIC